MKRTDQPGTYQKFATKQMFQAKKILVQFTTLMDFCHLTHSELETPSQMHNGRVVLRRGNVKEDFRCKAVSTEQGASVFRRTTAKVLDTKSRLHEMAGEAHEAVSACAQVRVKDAARLLKLPATNVTTVCIRYVVIFVQQTVTNSNDLEPLEIIFKGHPLASLFVESQTGRKIAERKFGKWYKGFRRQAKLFLSVCNDDIKIVGCKEKLGPMWATMRTKED